MADEDFNLTRAKAVYQAKHGFDTKLQSVIEKIRAAVTRGEASVLLGYDDFGDYIERMSSELWGRGFVVESYTDSPIRANDTLHVKGWDS